MRKSKRKCPNCRRLEINIRKLRKENVATKMQLSDLEIKVAKLLKNSRTSSKPPSSDIVKPPNERRDKNNPRKTGGQPGHKKRDREPFSEKEIDKRHDLKAPNKCPDCGGELVKPDNDEPLVQQSVSLPEKPYLVHEIKRHPGYCAQCDKTHYKPMPEGFAKGQFFALDMQAEVAYLKSACHMSYTSIKKYLKEVRGISVSRGYLAKVVKHMTKSLEIPYEELRQILAGTSVLNIDETGWKENKAKRWAWVFCNSMFSFFKLSDSRASKVLEEILGPRFIGTIISDFFGAYRKYGNRWQQYCLAHLIREIIFLTTLPNKKTREFGKELLGYFKTLFDLWHDRKNMSRRKFLHQANKIVTNIIIATWRDDLSKDAQRIANRIVKNETSYFHFIKAKDVEPTNNEAERSLRALVIDRRITQGSRSQIGLTWTERIWTVINTCAKQARPTFDFLKKALNAKHHNRAAPSLLQA